MRRLIVGIVLLLGACAPYRLPGETAQDAFLRHESARRSLNDAMVNLRESQQYYVPAFPRSNVVNCTHYGNTTTCQ